MAQNERRFDIIPTDAYPPVMRPTDAADFLCALKSEKIAARATNVIAQRRSEICDAVRGGAVRLEAAARAGNFVTVYDEAHEIRGLARTGGLTAGGCIADGLCLYLDAVSRTQQSIDTGIVGLHVGAIARAVHAQDEATRLGSEVAEQLSALVARKLGLAAPQRFR